MGELKFNEYQKMAQRTSNTKGLAAKLENGLMGLNGEAGECIDIFKKYLFQEHELDREKLVDELGDVLWYIAEICEGLGIGMDEVAVKNIDKLKDRYPNGFESSRSIYREEEERIYE